MPDEEELTKPQKLEAIDAADEIDGAMTPYKANPDGRYAGISNDADRRLGEHKVDEHYTWRECSCEGVAREAEKILHTRGYEGDVGGGKGTGDCVFVYAYVIRPTTKEAKAFPLYSR
jgi:hypothetical protein